MWIFKNKKYLITNILIILSFILLIYLSNFLFYQKYVTNNNLFLNNVIANILEKYPNITKEEIVSLLNNSNGNNNILSEYGIYLDNSYVLNNNKLVKYNNISNLVLVIFLSLSLFIIYLIKLKKVNKELNYILSYLKDINMGIYKLEIDSNHII